VSSSEIHVALVGNPNVGKTSLFNQLTGLNQKTGNFAGVTVDKKTGFFKPNENLTIKITDLPGTYSLHSDNEDEKVTQRFLVSKEEKIDTVIFIADCNNLRRNLYLFTQIKELGYKIIVCLNFHEEAEKNGIKILDEILSLSLQVPVVRVNAKKGQGIRNIGHIIQTTLATQTTNNNIVSHSIFFQAASPNTTDRYQAIDKILEKSCHHSEKFHEISFSQKLDAFLTHPIYGYLIFFGILTAIFQTIFNLSSYPMDLIDSGISWLSGVIENVLPEGPLNSLITQGIIPGLGGIIIFIPQIAFLFLLISILEESGYMARVVILMDPLLKKFGLNGKSIIPFVSASACAIPAVMAARSIENPKERLITILTAPFISCSARLPVYAILIALLTPENMLFGFLNTQGLYLLGLYLLGAISALIASWILSKFVRASTKGYFLIELPPYRFPSIKNTAFTIFDKSKSFVLEAGKIILAISIVLWALASYGPSDKMEKVEEEVSALNISKEEKDKLIEAKKLEVSYAGTFGKFLEPAIKPLGYDWKIGIALLTSFAAREVFVGTINTIYSINEDEEDIQSIKNRLQKVKDENGEPFFTTARSMSLLLFYVFAMQCMSTLAIVYKETKTIKWPLIQLFMMSGLAYLTALIAYQTLR